VAEQDHLISNQTYNVLKQVVTIVLPAIATLYYTLAQIWGLPNPEEVVATIAALTTFLGVCVPADRQLELEQQRSQVRRRPGRHG
jgi:hypothetical protein